MHKIPIILMISVVVFLLSKSHWRRIIQRGDGEIVIVGEEGKII